MKNHEIKITTTYVYTDDDMENICITALEGGIGYWACLDNTGADWEAKPKGVPTSVWFYKLLKQNKAIRFYDAEDDEESWLFDMSTLYNGIAKAIMEKAWDGDIDTIDAEVADMIFQYGLFDEVVYG